MSHERIKRILETRLQAYADSKGIRVAYAGIMFEPLANETYIKSFVAPATTDSRDLKGDHRVYIGDHLMVIMTPQNTGTKPANDIASDLEQYFPLYERLYESGSSGFSVQPITPIQTPEGRIEETNYILPVSYRYRADQLLS